MFTPVTPSDPEGSADVLILGGGPAGCSAASWLAQLGLSVTLVERADRLCAGLQGLQFQQDWVLGHAGETLAELGRRYAAQVLAQARVRTLLGCQPTHADWQPGQGWRIRVEPGPIVAARALILATGLRPLRPAAFFPPGARHERVLDALDLTARRATLPPGHTLLLGGGDNAVENALYLSDRGHRVTLRARSAFRAQRALVERLGACATIVRQPHTPLPTRVHGDASGVLVVSNERGEERFDYVAVCLGYEAEPSAWLVLGDALQRAGIPAPSRPFRDEPRLAPLGLFVAGDASGRQHPSVQTALGDGVVAAKAAELFLRARGEEPQAAPVLRNNRQIIHLQGLLFDASLGVLESERKGPQPIRVDAEVNLGAQAIVSRDADIGRVLDYRRVRQIILDECTAEHTDLLEALLGKLCARLMSLPGVVGVRIKVTKLEIFPDCQVTISAECGQW